MISRDRPRLREVHARFVEHEGETVVRIIDPLGIGPGPHAPPWFVSEAEWNIAKLLNGTRNAEAVSLELATPPADESSVIRVVQALSRRFLLDDEVFEEALCTQLDSFRGQPYRQMVGSGREYSADNIDLRIQLAGIVANDWDMPEIPPLHGLLLPSRGFQAAAKLYARGYAALRHQVKDIARIVMLGTCNAKLDRLLVPLTLSSKTAFGISQLDAQALRALSVVPGRDEIAHRDALVLERHQLFTSLLAPKVPVLPILVSEVDDLSDPDVTANVNNAVSSLQRVKELPGRTLFIAASDFAHFESAESESTARELRALDADISDCATRIKPDEFWDATHAPSDLRVIRKPLAAYLLLRVLEHGPALRGAVAGYLQMRSEAHLTSAASLAFFED